MISWKSLSTCSVFVAARSVFVADRAVFVAARTVSVGARTVFVGARTIFVGLLEAMLEAMLSLCSANNISMPEKLFLYPRYNYYTIIQYHCLACLMKACSAITGNFAINESARLLQRDFGASSMVDAQPSERKTSETQEGV